MRLTSGLHTGRPGRTAVEHGKPGFPHPQSCHPPPLKSVSRSVRSYSTFQEAKLVLKAPALRPFLMGNEISNSKQPKDRGTILCVETLTCTTSRRIQNRSLNSELASVFLVNLLLPASSHTLTRSPRSALCAPQPVAVGDLQCTSSVLKKTIHPQS